MNVPIISLFDDQLVSMRDVYQLVGQMFDTDVRYATVARGTVMNTVDITIHLTGEKSTSSCLTWKVPSRMNTRQAPRTADRIPEFLRVLQTMLAERFGLLVEPRDPNKHGQPQQGFNLQPVRNSIERISMVTSTSYGYRATTPHTEASFA
jgi:hypothetical protein